ncbi:MAG: carboxypeptidase regulatory-like domain-containing protein [Candidatus Methylacidiphilales bacterium]
METWIDRLGWTLLHALWQGGAVWLILQLVLAVMRRSGANARYLAACSALAAMVLLPWLTYFTQDFQDRVVREQTAIGRIPQRTDVPDSTSTPYREGGVMGKNDAQQTAASSLPQPPALQLLPSPRTAQSALWPGDLQSASSYFGVQVQHLQTLRKIMPWLVGAWVCGVILFATRLGFGLRSLERLAGATLIPLDSAWQAHWQQLMKRAGIRRLVCMGECVAVQVPTVVGWLKPVVLLPIGVLSGLPMAQVEAILLHELAHIRRQDFVVNLLQNVAETLLFYHPAIWSISARIRLERELACDDLAMEWCADRLGYAEALAAFEGLRSAPLGMAITGDPKPGSSDAVDGGTRAGKGDLFMRVQRILFGIEPSRSSLPPSRVLSLCGLVAVGAYLSSVMLAPVLAADWILAEERIRVVEAAKKKALAVDPGSLQDASVQALAGNRLNEPVRVFGRVRTEDGAPVPRAMGIVLKSNTRNQYSTYLVNNSDNNGNWSVDDVSLGQISVNVLADGYAPLIAENLPVRDNKCGPLDLVLHKGFSAKVRILSPDGKPLPKAEVRQKLEEMQSAFLKESNAASVSDEAGMITLTNVLADSTLELKVLKAGYQATQKRFTNWTEGKALDWVLQPAAPTTGMVTDASAGKPIPGAKISIARVRSGTDDDSEGQSPVNAPLLGTCDENGHFHLDSLNSNNSYQVYVSAPGYATTVFPLRSGVKDMALVLPPGLHIRGKIQDPHGLLKPYGDGSFRVGIRTSIKSSEQSHMVYDVAAPAQSVSGDLRFEIKDLSPGKVTLNLFVWSKAVSEPLMRSYDLAVKENLDGYAFVVEKVPAVSEAEARLKAMDPPLRESSKTTPRTIEITLNAGKGAPPPTGLLRADWEPIADNPQAGVERRRTQWVSLINGVATFKADSAGRFRFYPDELVGYWFDKAEMEITAVATGAKAEEPVRKTLDLLPAGAIHAKIITDPGLKDRDYSARVVMVTPPPEQKFTSLWEGPSGNPSGPEYTTKPLPLGGTYIIVLEHGPYYCASKPVRLDDANPVAEVSIHRPVPGELRGRFLTRDGKPLALKEIELNYEISRNGIFSSSVGTTDADGAFVIPGVNLDASGSYYMTLHSDDWSSDYQKITRDTPQPIILKCDSKAEMRRVRNAPAPSP